MIKKNHLYSKAVKVPLVVIYKDIFQFSLMFYKVFPIHLVKTQEDLVHSYRKMRLNRFECL